MSPRRVRRLYLVVLILLCVGIPTTVSHSKHRNRDAELKRLAKNWRTRPDLSTAERLVNRKLLVNLTKKEVHAELGPEAIAIEPQQIGPHLVEETSWYAVPPRGQLIIKYLNGRAKAIHLYLSPKRSDSRKRLTTQVDERH